mmetsp:Transcript_110951/g.155778  ORF Transcript_110951/g.155778 Transcript_110951/m.155778 type:complete len:164 (+) Transcript_110951:81-572(+)
MSCKLVVLGLLMSVPFGKCDVSANVTNTTEEMTNAPWGSFIECSCGLQCQVDLQTQHSFQLGKGCGCTSCRLRKSSAAVKAPEVKAPEATEFLAMLAEEEQDWDAASVPGDSHLFCRCGTNGNACQSCSTTRSSCPCGTRCLRRLQWFGGAGWCIRRQCIPCR